MTVVLTQMTSVTQSLAAPRAGSVQQQSCARAEVAQVTLAVSYKVHDKKAEFKGTGSLG